jgi:hypothetical protein
MNKMQEIQVHLPTSRIQGDVLFYNSWGIFASFTGQIQARSCHDSADRYGVGSIADDPKAIAEAIKTLP